MEYNTGRCREMLNAMRILHERVCRDALGVRGNTAGICRNVTFILRDEVPE